MTFFSRRKQIKYMTLSWRSTSCTGNTCSTGGAATFSLAWDASNLPTGTHRISQILFAEIKQDSFCNSGKFHPLALLAHKLHPLESYGFGHRTHKLVVLLPAI